MRLRRQLQKPRKSHTNKTIFAEKIVVSGLSDTNIFLLSALFHTRAERNFAKSAHLTQHLSFNSATCVYYLKVNNVVRLARRERWTALGNMGPVGGHCFLCSKTKSGPG